MGIPGIANAPFAWPSLKSATKLWFLETKVALMQMLLNNFILLSVSGNKLFSKDELFNTDIEGIF